MNKKIVILGGGTGMSTLLRGLKEFPLDITAIVSVCDDGNSSGRLREEFNIPAVGDIRKVLVSLSSTEPLFEKLLNYRFEDGNGLKGHAVGNILLTAMANITGNVSDGIESISKILNLKGKVVPLTEQSNITLVAKMEDGSFIEGEHHITEANKKIVDVFYKEEPIVTPASLEAIKQADLIILSMGSLYTSIIPNLICKDIINEIDNSKAKIIYACNMMTQPGETDDFTVFNHIEVLNRYLGKRKVDMVIANNGKIDSDIVLKYATLEQKDPVIIDDKVLNSNVQLVQDNFVIVNDGYLRHNALKLAFHIFNTLI